MNDLYYILDDKNQVTVVDREVYFADQAKRDGRNPRVAETDLPNYWISTVFLGIDHAFGGGEPVVFETMVFKKVDGKPDMEGEAQDRYCTWDEAVKGHETMVAQYKAIEEASS